MSIFYSPMRRQPPECWLRRIERAELADDALLSHRVLAEEDA